MKTRGALRRKKNGTPFVQKIDFSVKTERSARLTGKQIWNMRTYNPKTTLNELGEITLIKTGVLIDSDRIVASPTFLKRAKLFFNEKIKKIKSDRPVKIVETSDHGSPLKGETPGKTPMYRHTTTGLITFMTNQPPNTKDNEPLVVKKLFFTSDEYQAAPTVTELSKKRSFTVHKNLRRNKKPRKDTMYIPCTRYLNAARGTALPPDIKTTKLPLEKQANWSHLQGHGLNGNESPSNKGALFHGANTLNILPDEGSKILARTFTRAKIEVEMPLFKDTHIPDCLHYRQMTDTISLDQTLKNVPTVPLRDTRPYHFKFYEALAEAHENKGNDLLPEENAINRFYTHTKLAGT